MYFDRFVQNERAGIEVSTPAVWSAGNYLLGNVSTGEPLS
jgi:hypothetical protein